MFNRIEENSGLIVIAMDHGKVNAMDMEFCTALIRELQSLEKLTSCRAVVLSSQKEVFSAGIDLKRWLAEGPDYVEPYMNQLEELFQTVFCFSKPLVSDICGPAIAGGCMVAAAADFRIIRPKAKMGILESRLGVPLPMMAIEILRHYADSAAFRSIISVGATFLGESAVQHGLADRVSHQSRADALEFAEQLATIPAQAFHLTKCQRTDPVIRIVRANQQRLKSKYLEIWKSTETRIAIQRYVDERLK